MQVSEDGMTIGITGATGFVGCRLAERLTLETDHHIRAVVRRFSGLGLARLARMPVELARADLLDEPAVHDALAGCDVVVHCAYGTTGDSELKRRVTVEGTENVLRAATAAGARRVIHLSSAVVHEVGDRAVVDESAPIVEDTGGYAGDKVAAEEVVWRYHRERGLPVVVFRPTLIYGPHGRRWTVRIAQEILDGAYLVNGGTGAANLVYVDNLVDAILAAVESDRGDGEAFLAVDGDGLTWGDVYRAYARSIPDAPPLHSATTSEIEEMRRAARPNWFRASFVTPLSLAPRLGRAGLARPDLRRDMKTVPWIRALKRMLPGSVVDRLKRPATAAGEAIPATRSDASAAYPLPAPDLVELYASTARYSAGKLQRVLGHRQRTDFAEGLRRTVAWLRYQRVIPGNGGDGLAEGARPAFADDGARDATVAPARSVEVSG